ncbi:MAG TPA: sugar phosphate nucleotidyltransferase [Terriglobia bacterium]|nr:sugar phosphate nucleotidyltransferase [Terriglobia bacterium]
MLEPAVCNYPEAIEPKTHSLVKTLILAGGRGERMSPLTESRPKPLLPFGDSRIIDFTLQNCFRSDLKEAVLLTQYKHEQISAYVRDTWGGQYRCLAPVTGKRYHGVADAVYQNASLLIEDAAQHVLILSASCVHQMDYRRLISRHIESGADATVSAIRLSEAAAAGLSAMTVGPDLGIRDYGVGLKPECSEGRLVAAGATIFKMRVLVESLARFCERGFGIDMDRDVIPWLVESARVMAWEYGRGAAARPFWSNIRTLDDYYVACMTGVGAMPGPTARRVSRRGAPRLSSLCGSAQVVDTVLADGVRVEEGARVEHSVLMPGVKVGEGARLRRVIVDEGVQIPANTSIGGAPQRDSERYTISPGGVTVVSAGAIDMPGRFRPRRERTALVRPKAASGHRLLLWKG